MRATKIQEKKLKSLGFWRRNETYMLSLLFGETRITKPRPGTFNIKTYWTDDFIGKTIIKRNLTWKKLKEYCERSFK